MNDIPAHLDAPDLASAMTPNRNQLSNAAGEVEQQRAIAETKAAMIIAKNFPRDIKGAIKTITEACKRPTLAEQATYEYARGGTEIVGPSIRLAEAIAQCWGNMQFGIRELSQANGESTVEAFAWDIETNTRQVKVFQVPHKRYTRKGSYAVNDPRDIYEMVANNGARRLRACILGTIPGDIIETAVKQCDATILASVDMSNEGIEKLLTAFEPFKVNKLMIEKRIQRTIDSIKPSHVVALRRIYNSLKDGIGSAGDYFEESLWAASAATARPQDEGARKTPAKKADEKPAPKTVEKVDPQTGEVTDGVAQQNKAPPSPTPAPASAGPASLNFAE